MRRRLKVTLARQSVRHSAYTHPRNRIWDKIRESSKSSKSSDEEGTRIVVLRRVRQVVVSTVHVPIFSPIIDQARAQIYKTK